MPSVLIVDDEPNIRRMVGALLTSEGYEVRDAADGATAIARAAESAPDVVLLDLMIPGELDGLATLARLRESAPDVPVIMMSGKAGLSDAGPAQFSSKRRIDTATPHKPSAFSPNAPWSCLAPGDSRGFRRGLTNLVLIQNGPRQIFR